MEDELDIKLGLWNQAYFFDVLPLKYESHTQIVPGDLILYIGKYPGEKQQKHNVVLLKQKREKESGRRAYSTTPAIIQRNDLNYIIWRQLLYQFIK
ncbi:Conserved_hypothetical protein [Hexamita inflata]|uniref:Uncharacterized protein n=1 Tax=Hexamita inflata TaxID=28002 RepID=A0AA86QXD5_9EUKA|nr:Conserved hypothetical protein [Hexamita inflata]